MAGRGSFHVRYLLPAWFLVAAGLGLLLERLSRFSRVAATLVAAILLAHHAAGWDLPGSAQRNVLEIAARADERAVRDLEARGVRVACGGFWTVYPFNFLSRERVLGVPGRPEHDVFSYGARVDGVPGAFALVSGDDATLERWTRAAGLSGEFVAPAPGYVAALLPTPPEASKARLLARVQETWNREGLLP